MKTGFGLVCAFLACFGGASPTHALTLLNFGFSITDGVDTVTGRFLGIEGDPNGDPLSSPVPQIIINSYSSGLGLSGLGFTFPTPLEVSAYRIGVGSNLASVENGEITALALDEEYGPPLADTLHMILQISFQKGGTATATLGQAFADSFPRFTGAISIEPIPIPAALPLFAGGLGMLGAIVYRRKQKTSAGSGPAY